MTRIYDFQGLIQFLTFYVYTAVQKYEESVPMNSVNCGFGLQGPLCTSLPEANGGELILALEGEGTHVEAL